jgi:hypothetical protein
MITVDTGLNLYYVCSGDRLLMACCLLVNQPHLSYCWHIQVQVGSYCHHLAFYCTSATTTPHATTRGTRLYLRFACRDNSLS